MQLLKILSPIITILTFLVVFDIIDVKLAQTVFSWSLASRLVLFFLLIFSLLSTTSNIVAYLSKQSPAKFITPLCILAIINAYIVMQLTQIIILSTLPNGARLLAVLAILVIAIIYSSVIIARKLSHKFLFSETEKYATTANFIFNGSMGVMYCATYTTFY